MEFSVENIWIFEKNEVIMLISNYKTIGGIDMSKIYLVFSKQEGGVNS